MAEMPLLESLLRWEEKRSESFHTPGHRQGREILSPVRDLLPDRLWTLDATELPVLDDLHHPCGPIARAQD
ncbi:MAG TPA: decarboxylase, partial [Firmicutes bacterium]|nr:decarboxylase [Bacillota bacterium]